MRGGGYDKTIDRGKKKNPNQVYLIISFPLLNKIRDFKTSHEVCGQLWLDLNVRKTAHICSIFQTGVELAVGVLGRRCGQSIIAINANYVRI